jgi:hypothetical protein
MFVASVRAQGSPIFADCIEKLVGERKHPNASKVQTKLLKYKSINLPKKLGFAAICILQYKQPQDVSQKKRDDPLTTHYGWE